MSAWISVLERLPEPYVAVLVWLEEAFLDCHIGVAWIEDDDEEHGGKYWLCHTEDHNLSAVTHWQPAPAGPGG